MNKKILCTGDPNKTSTLAHAVKKLFPNAEFLHRSMGVDLTTEEGLSVFKETVADFDVFINSSYIGPGVQERLLRITKELWTEGYVFNIGSVAEYQSADVNCMDRTYIDSKISLRNTSMALGWYDFKTTHLLIGGFKDITDPADPRMDPLRIVEIIDWIMNSNEFWISSISVLGPPINDLRPSTDIS